MIGESNSIENVLLGLFLIEEEGKPASKWRDYIALLPKDYSNFPKFFTREELEMLKGT